MPVIGIPVAMLLERIESELDRDHLVERLQHLGCDVEGYATMKRFRCRRCDNILEITETENPPVACDRCGADFKANEELREELGESDVIRMELLAVRPDMFDPGGLARVLRNYLGERDEPARYTLAEPTISVQVDPRLALATSYRPHIACAVVRDISLDEDRIKVIMKLQENLHWALGRDRKRASIGVYDLDRLSGSGFAYRSVGPQELRFVALGCDEPMTPAEILERHPKGTAYARLLADYDRYPLLTDEEGTVLSMPPIINSEETRVTQQTRNFFVDVTGTEERIVNKTLNTIVTSLAELDSDARLEAVRIEYQDSSCITPDLTPQELTLDPDRAARTIGVAMDRGQVVRRLLAMGHEVDGATSEGPLTVRIPAYRNDIMHEIDLIEDVAIAYGYHNIEPSLVPTLTVGGELEGERLCGVARSALTGLGYFEVLTLILSCEEDQSDRMGLERRQDFVALANPISVEQTLIRTSLLPGLLDTFSVNTDHELPQSIFEVGNVSFLDPDSQTGAREHRRVAAGAIGPRVDFGEQRAVCEALLREFGWRLETEPCTPGCFIPGRGARAVAVRGEVRREVGLVGEVHPRVLEAFKLSHPVSLFEIDLEALA